MEKYDPKTLEQRWYETWESAGYFAPSGQGPAFSIAIPPPNVTGTLHMGHAFQHSLVDAVIRRKRMQGYNTLWQMGTDHAGISTQLIVAEQLAKENLKPLDIGREAFINGPSIGKINPAVKSASNCGAWARPYTGKQNALRWMKA